MRQGSGERSGPGAAGPGLGCAVLPLARARRFPCAQPAEGCRLFHPRVTFPSAEAALGVAPHGGELLRGLSPLSVPGLPRP